MSRGGSRIKIVNVGESSLVILTDAATVDVRCTRGALWVTSGDGRELALAAGGRGRLERPGKVAVQGMKCGDVEMEWR